MRFLILVLAVYGPLVSASPPLTCGYTSDQSKPPIALTGCPSGVTSLIYTTPDTNNVLPPIGSSQITIYMEATILATCGVPGDLYLYTLRKTSNDDAIITMGYVQSWSTLLVVARNLVGVNSGQTFPLTAPVTYVLTYDLATGKGFAGVITATDKLFWTSSGGASSMTNFDADMTLYLCANMYTHAGFQCQIDVLKMWPVYDESFLLSFLFGQTPSPLLLYVLKETSGTSVANAYNPATSNSATLSTTGATLPTWATTGIGINIADPSQYISLPAFIPGGANTYMRASFTISTWIKIAAAPSTDRYIFLRKSNAAALRAAVALTSARKVKVILESSTSYTQTSNGVVPLNTWTSITVTIVQTITAWGYAASAIVINNVFDVGKLNSQVQAAMTSYTLTDVNMIGGAPNSLVGVYAHFTIFSPGSMAFTSPPCPVSTGSNGDLGYGVTQSLMLIPICDPNCDGCYGTSAAQCFSCASGRGLYSGLCTICPSGTYLQGSICINSPPGPNDEMGAAEAAALAAKIGVIAMAGIAGTTFVLKANPALLWALINFLQMFYYLTFINVDYPLNVQIFLEIFQVAALDFIPNPIEDIFSDAEKNSVQVPGKYDYYGVEGLFLINSYPILLTWGVYILFYLFALLARICVPKDSKTLVKNISKIVDWYQWSGLIGILIASYPDIVQSAFLQVRALTFSSALFSISSVLSIVFTIFAVGLPLLFIVIIQKSSNNLTNLEKKYQILVEKCNIKSALPRYVATIFLVRAMILDAALVLLQYYPVVQISFLIVSSSIILLILVLKRNIYTSLMDTYCRILQEFFFVVLYINILLLSIEANTFSYEAKINVGWIIIGCCGVIFSAFLGNGLYETFHAIKEFFKNFRRSESVKQSGKRRKQRVQELSDTTQYDIENSDLSISHTKAHLNLNSSLETSYDQPRLGKNQVIATLDQLHQSKLQSRSFNQSQGNIKRPSLIQGQSVSGLDLQRIGTVANKDGDRSNKTRLSSTPDNSKQNTKKKNSGKDTIKHLNPIFRSELNKYK